MSEFLTTRGVAHRLEEIIKSANERLILVSPFLKLDEGFKALLQEKDHLNIDVRFIYGKKELPSSESNWLASMSSIRAGFLQDLHAKCYLNEKEALLTSMNLHASSQRYNYEMGVYVSQAEDPQLYKSILDEVNRLWTMSSKSPENGTSFKSGVSNSTPQNTQHGFCIRCAKPKDFKPYDAPNMEPYCPDCYTDWTNKDDHLFRHPEKYCHSCGNEHEGISYSRPMCRPCYSQNPTPPPLKTSAQP